MARTKDEINEFHKTALICGVLCVIILNVAIFTPWGREYFKTPLRQTQKAMGKKGSTSASMMCSIEVTLERDGKVVEKQFKENDIFVRNFPYHILSYWGEHEFYDYTDDTGGVDEYDTGIRSSLCDIGYGSGLNAPAILDFSLQTEIARKAIGSQGVSISGSEMNVTYATTFPITSGQTINEVGWFVRVGTDDVLFARDVLQSPIIAVNGDSLTVRYLITFNGS